MHGGQIKQLHHAGVINLRVAAITRANGMLPVTQILMNTDNRDERETNTGRVQEL
jgi:hypothetical protein